MDFENNTLLTLEELKAAVCGTVVAFAENLKKFSFTSVVTDSRNVVKKSLFVPLIGEFQDGHKYIPSAVEKGASVIFVTDFVYNADSRFYTDLVSKNEELVIIVVKNNMTALQDAARVYVRKFPKLIKVAITGSSGKTTTKEICKSILSQKYNVISTVGNLNSETGLPLSVFNIRAEHELGLFEMGMNRENEIGEIARVLRPNYAIITNIGNAHIGILGSRDNIANEKKKIFTYIDENGTAIIHKDDDYADFLAKDVKGRVVYFGKNISEKESGVKFIEDLGLLGTKFTIDSRQTILKIPGCYNYLNMLSAICLARSLSVPSNKIVDGINLLQPVDGRSSIKEVVTKKDKAGAQKKITVLEDCYNANPDSMEKALEMCSSLKVDGRKIYVLGDMFELGNSSTSVHSHIGTVATVSDADFVIFIGKEMERAAQVAKIAGFEKFKYFENLDEENLRSVNDYILENLLDGDFIFLKASHGMHLEKILQGIEDNSERL